MFIFSIVIMVDVFNNFFDMVFLVIIMIGFKLVSKLVDKEYFFGYGRIEYLLVLIVVFMVMLVGF